MTKLELLENCFIEAKEVSKYVAIAIQFDDMENLEIIINPVENVEDKISYFKMVYDDNLNHKHSSSIKIVKFAHGKNFEEIEKQLV